ncbi:hypothetical protein F5X68DRAFT_240016 [Plectosphaerella plurivora]|uniref:Uncharacterized protein n=1 Tax=Plectosphaerella plurivora TaxID=936078 RepID=A0A9P8VDX9_9PEZI|nr:hypothetical protein F5X68DRAFT_240016 [Plectosphaerella plurivora]
MFWSPEEIAVFIDMVQQHESRVYSPRRVQWHLMSELLEAQGVRKSTKEIKTLYVTLRDAPNVVFISHRVSAWRGVWSELVSLKKYLTENRLVHPPKDDNDLFHHIPALEDGRKTVDFIAALLSKTDDRSGFRLGASKNAFLSRHLANLLHRDVWERITGRKSFTPIACFDFPETGPPPMSMALRTRSMGKVVTDRVIAVMMHHGRKLYGEEDHGEDTATSTVSLPQLTWPMALELWHGTKSDLMASGVPPDQILSGGMPQILTLWQKHKKSFWDAEHTLTLPPWEFEPGVQAREAHDYRIPTMTRAAHESDDVETHSFTGIPGNAYVWPSNTDKYAALASSMKDFSDMTSQVQGHAFTLPSTISGPAQLAQHQVSTFRLLASIMQRYHREVFDCDSDHTSDEAFWEVLYIGPLSGEWHIQDIRRLKDRFEWVLDYVRKGWVIDSEAMVAKDILREVLASNVLSRNTHPYNTDIAQPALDYLKPDLCPKWIKRLLATSGVLPEVESLIQSRLDHMGIAGFCDKYGLLIAPLWENFGLSQDDEEFIIDRQEATQADINVDEFELEQHGREIGPQPILPSALAPVGDPEKPSSPLKRKAPADLSDPGDAPETEEAPKRRNLRPRASRVNSEASVTSTIATTTPLPGAQVQPSFSASTGTSSLVTPPVPPTASPSGSSRVQVQKQVMAPPEPPMKDTKSFWTMEQDAWLRDVHAQNISVNDQVPLFEERFGFNKNSQSIRDRLKRLGLKTRHKEEHRWTSAEEEFLRSLRPSEIEQHVSMNETCKLFWTKFGHSRSKGAIATKLHVLAGNYPETTQKWWSDEEVAFLRNSTDLQPDHAALADALNAEFGTQRSAEGVKKRLALFTVKVQYPNTPWSPEEDDVIRAYPGISTMKSREVAVALNAEFGTQRNMSNVRSRIIEVAQLRVREVWTKVEEDFALHYDGLQWSPPPHSTKNLARSEKSRVFATNSRN